MPAVTPETLVTVLSEVVDKAADGIRKEFDDRVERIKQDADGAWQQITEEIKQPSWRTYLLYLLIRIRELDPQHIAVGIRQTDKGELVTLTYTPVLPNTLALRLGLGKDGLLAEATGTGSSRFRKNGVRAAIEAEGADGEVASWWLPFTGSPEMPQQAAVLDVTASWTLSDPGDVDEAGVGPIYLHGHLTTAGTPRYELLVGLGDGTADGVKVNLDFAERLGFLGEAVSIAPLRDAYSPNLRVASGEAPTFSVGHRGPAMRGG